MTDDATIERVRLYGQNSHALYFVTGSPRAKGGEITVRLGKERVFACMTCLGASCVHARKVREYWEWLTPEEREQAIAALEPAVFGTVAETPAAAESPAPEAIEWLI